jgi:hypothetical protein
MKVCDRCKEGDKPIITVVRIQGKTFELYKDCAECTSNYIQFSYKPAKGFAKFGEMFKQ